MTFTTKLFCKYLLVFFIPAVFLTGCGVWENFTTYFNLYYNTTETFEEVEKAIYEQDRDLFSTEELNIPTATSQALVKVVEKTSKILQFHPSSSYVDDALLMLGKAFYYQKNYQKALRKFQELITAQSESDLSLETYLWIGKTQMRLKEYEKGLETLDAVLDTAITEGEDDIIKDAFVEEIVYHVVNKNYSNAIAISKQFIEEANDDVVKAEVYYEIGKLYLEMDDIENSIASFKEVNNYSPDYEIEVGAYIELAKALRQSGKQEEALSILEEMGDEDKYFDDYPEIDLETGITLIELKRFDEALELLTYVDTSYATTLFSGTARYKKGELYEYQFKNFDSASVFYQKAAGSNSPAEIIVAANGKNQKFKKYQNLSAELFRSQLNLNYILNPDLFIQDSLKIVDSIRAQQDEQEIAQNFDELAESDIIDNSSTSNSNSNINNNSANNNSFPNVNGDQNQLLDTLANQVNNQGNLTDSLGNPINNSLDPNKVNNNSLNNQNQVNNNTQNNQNQVNDRDTRDQINRRQDRRPPTTNQQNQNISTTFKLPVRPTLSEDSLKSLIVKTKFELANLFFTEFNLPDSAYIYYSDILENYPKSTFRGRALFGIGSYFETVENKQRADSIYNVIYNDFRTEQIVNSAATKINKPLIDLEYDPAKSMYEEAEKLLNNKNYNESLTKLNEIYNNYPKSQFAPKALYTSGWVLENELKLYDSAAVVYDSIAAKYPQTKYASSIMPKLNFYKSQQELKRKAVQDSIKAANLVADSLANLQMQADSVNNPNVDIPIQTPVDNNDEQLRPQTGNKTAVDSLRQEHKVIVDSLNRAPGSIPGNNNLPQTIDSLNQGGGKRLLIE